MYVKKKSPFFFKVKEGKQKCIVTVLRLKPIGIAQRLIGRSTTSLKRFTPLLWIFLSCYVNFFHTRQIRVFIMMLFFLSHSPFSPSWRDETRMVSCVSLNLDNFVIIVSVCNNHNKK